MCDFLCMYYSIYPWAQIVQNKVEFTMTRKSFFQGSLSITRSLAAGCADGGLFNSWSVVTKSSLVMSRVVSNVTLMAIEFVSLDLRRRQMYHTPQTSNLLPKHKKMAVGTATQIRNYCVRVGGEAHGTPGWDKARQWVFGQEIPRKLYIWNQWVTHPTDFKMILR